MRRVSAAAAASRCCCRRQVVSSSARRRVSSSAAVAAAPATTPVAIVGGGPVGLTLALLLSKLGVRSTVLERLPAPSVHPQAHFINVRSMEVFRSLVDREGRSVADAITRLARPRDEWSRFLYSEFRC